MFGHVSGHDVDRHEDRQTGGTGEEGTAATCIWMVCTTGLADGWAVTLIGKLDDQRNHWEGEYPTQALGSGQVAPHERWRAQRARSEALAKRVFLNTQVGHHDLATSRYRTSRYGTLLASWA